jgi:hypothetical protein
MVRLRSGDDIAARRDDLGRNEAIAGHPKIAVAEPPAAAEC